MCDKCDGVCGDSCDGCEIKRKRRITWMFHLFIGKFLHYTGFVGCCIVILGHIIAMFYGYNVWGCLFIIGFCGWMLWDRFVPGSLALWGVSADDCMKEEDEEKRGETHGT